jgi:uncharacterized protein YaeQ
MPFVLVQLPPMALKATRRRQGQQSTRPPCRCHRLARRHGPLALQGPRADGTLAQMHPASPRPKKRLMMRLLAFALQVPASDHGRRPAVQARGLSDSDEPDLWQHDLTGVLLHWIEVGQPDDRRLAKACGRAAASRSTATAAPATGLVGRRCSQGGAAGQPGRVADAGRQPGAGRAGPASMQLQVTVQDGHVWVSDRHGQRRDAAQALKTATR